MNYHIAICDDNPTDTNYISNLVSLWAKDTSNTINISLFPSAEAFLFHYEEDKSYDILLLDIEMGSMNGIELAKQIRKDNDRVQIVFITGYPDFIAEGYEVAAIHYLMKPVVESKLFTVLDKAITNMNKADPSVILAADATIHRIPVSDIIAVEAFAHTCIVTTRCGELEVRTSITEMEKLLGDNFVRCHRSYLVAVRYICKIMKNELILDTGKLVPLSRRNRHTVSKAFIHYYKGDMICSDT